MACASVQTTAQAAVQIQEPTEEYLYLDAFVDKRAQDDPIEVYTEDFSQYFVAIDALKPLLSVDLTIDETTITGWFFYQNNRVKGDLVQQQINIGDTTLPLTPKDLITREGQYYLTANTINTRF
ncbi:MAG: hypothetical protein MJK04_14795, partial [Psychrosphaera sp.]|nr:hypothetical protein [Psychrosphaera sp.]